MGALSESAANRIRVLFIAKRVVGGGAERVMTILMRHLNRFLFEPHLLTISIDAYRQDIPEDVVIHKLRARELRWVVPQLASTVRHVHPQVVLSTLTEANVAVLLASLFFQSDTKVIVREAFNPSDMLNHLLAFPFPWRLAYRYLYPHADAIVCQSRSMQADVLRNVPISPHKVCHIYNGVDASLIEQRAGGPSPYPAGGPNLLAAGRLCPQKNFSLLLDSFALIRASCAGARLTIIGTGPDEMLLKRRARELHVEDAVIFAGFQDNPFLYYRHADLYLQTSIFEGLPNVLLEVLSLGTPAVATLAGGSTAEIAEVTKSVRLVSNPGPRPFADAALEVLCRPRTPLCRDNYLDVFGVERMMMEYEKLFADIAGTLGAESRSSGIAIPPS